MIGKILADRWGWTEKLGGAENVKTEPIDPKTKEDIENLKEDIKDCNTTIEIDAVVKKHGLQEIENLSQHIKELQVQGKIDNLDTNKVNDLIQTQNYTNIANAAHGFKGVKQAIDEYNKGIKEGTLNTDKFVSTISSSNTNLGKYLTGLKGADAGLIGYGKSLVTATAKTFILKTATLALNAVISMVASFIVSTVISAIASWADNIIHASEKIKEAAEEAKSAIDTIKSEFDTLKSTTNDVKERFAELAQGVENLGKVNQSRGTLSTDDYDEFLDLSNQLAELFPQLTRDYDDNGNAILGLSGNIDTIVDSLDNLVSVQQKLTNQEILEKMPDVWAEYTTNLDEYTEELDDAQRKVDGFNNSLSEIDYGVIKIKDSKTNIAIEEALKKALDIDWYKNGRLYQKSTIGVDAGTVTWNFSTLTESQFNQFANELGALGAEYEDAVQLAKSKIKAANSEMSSYINTWLSTDAGARWNFSKMNSDMQNLVKDVLISSDWISKIPNKVDSDDWDEVSNWLQQKFLYAINRIDSEEIHNSLIDAFNNNISIESIEDLIAQLMETKGFDENNPLIIYLETKLENAQIFQEQYDDAIGKFGDEYKSTLDEFFKKSSIDNTSKIDYWNEITAGARNASEAIERYNKEQSKITIFTSLTDEQSSSIKSYQDTLSSIADIYENLDDIDKIKLMSTFSGYDWSKYLSGAESLDTTLRNIATKSLQSVINQFNGLSGCEPILEELKQKFEDTFNFDFDLSENLAAYEELKELLEDVSKGEVYQKEKIAYLTNKYHDLASAVEDTADGYKIEKSAVISLTNKYVENVNLGIISG